MQFDSSSSLVEVIIKYIFWVKNKSLAIPYVLKYYGIDIADSFAFGDSLNDMDVFRLIPNTCAVANAVPDLKKCASYVSAKRVADGVLDGLRFWGYSQFK